MPDGSNGFQHTCIRKVVLVENVVDGALRHGVNGLLEERGQTQLKLHEIAHEHHEVLCEVLELYQVHLHILQLVAVFPDAGIYFLKETLVGFIQFFQHLAAMRLFTKAQLVVLRWYAQGCFVRSQIGKHGQIGYTQVGCDGCLEVNSHQSHVVFHATRLRFVGLSFEY